MQIEVAKNDLEAALKVATIAMASGQTDLSSHYLFRTRNGKAEVLTYSHRAFCSAPLTCRTDGDGAFSVEGWRLRQWLQAVGDVAILFEFGDGVVQASTPRGKIAFASLDPSQFPYFEDNLEAAVVTGTVMSGRLAQVFNYANPFILDRENTHPQMSLIEAKDGQLFATDLAAMTLIRMGDIEDGEVVPVLGNSELRIHVKDVPSLIAFLKLQTDAKVEIMEHAGVCAMFRREDGCLFGCSRPQAGFPKFPQDVTVDAIDETFWVANVDELNTTILWLLSAAKRGEERVRFRWVKGELVMAMEAVTGGESTLTIEAIEHENLDSIPKPGFRLPHSYIKQITSNFTDEQVRFGIVCKTDDDGKPTGKGYVRFRHESGGDVYMTLVAWQ